MKNKFAGADDIYLTNNKIAVRNVSSWHDKFGKFHMSDKTKYYKKTKSNLDDARKIVGSLRFGRY